MLQAFYIMLATVVLTFITSFLVAALIHGLCKIIEISARKNNAAEEEIEEEIAIAVAITLALNNSNQVSK